MIIQPGTDIGRYHILEQLGEGGMALVYKAYDTKLEREVALKVIRTDLKDNDRSLKRFKQEANALTKLTHPNIVNLIDFDVYDGNPYIVMEYIPAGNLKQQLSGPIPSQQAAALLAPIADALAYAHEQGILHRDVKPSNILITESGQPMLSDFGVAKVLETEETLDLTATGMGVGTPEYMAPEQFTTHDYDQRADIYALGVVMYEMVVGRKPFTADTPYAVAIKQSKDPLPRPSEFIADISESVERFLFKALAKDPSHRFASMKEMLAVLEQVAAGATIGKDLLPEVRSDAGPGRKRRWGVIGAVGMVLVAAIGFGLRWLLFPQPDDAVTPAEPMISEFTNEDADGDPTAEPTAEPIPFPYPAGVSLPESLQPITMDNISDLQLIARWGEGDIQKIGYSHTSAYFGVATSIGMHIYDPASFNEILFIETDAIIYDFDFSMDDEYVYLGLLSGEVIAYKIVNNEEVFRIQADEGPIFEIIVEPNNTYFLTGVGENALTTSDGLIKKWDLKNGELLGTLPGRESSLIGIDFSPNRDELIAGYSDGRIQIIDPSQEDSHRIVKAESGSGFYLGTGNLYYEEDRFLAVDGQGNIRLFSSSLGQLTDVIGGGGGVRSVDICRNEGILAVGDVFGQVIFYETNTFNVKERYPIFENIVKDIAFNQDCSRLVAESADGQLMEIRVMDGEILSVNERFHSGVTHAALSEEAGQIAYVTDTKYANIGTSAILMRDINNGNLTGKISDPEANIEALVFSDDGNYLFAGSDDASISKYDVRTGEGIWKIDANSNPSKLVFSEKNQMLISGNTESALWQGGGNLNFWNAETGSALKTLPMKSVVEIAIIGEENLIASSSRVGEVKDGKLISWEGELRLWSITNGDLLRTYNEDTHHILEIIVSTEGHRFFTTKVENEENIISIWNQYDSNPEFEFSVTNSGNSLILLDGELMISQGSSNGILDFFDLSNGKSISSMNAHNDSINNMFLFEEKLFTISLDGTIKVWGIPEP